jgi:glycolate dehydrogenase FAD-binding subunit
MKNVTGYDLSKLAAGSQGTLFALTEVTLKVLPKAETETTLFIFDEEARGLALLREASGLAVDISGFALSPRTADAPACAAFRFEGPELSVSARRQDFLRHVQGRAAGADMLDEDRSRAFWADVRDGGPVRMANGQVWRLSVAPKDGGAVVEALKFAGLPIEAYFYDWAGGLVWLAVDAAPHAYAKIVRDVVDRFGGHATLMRADQATRAAVPVFHPQPSALAALTKRVKESFDPLRLLNRGRLRPDV